MNKFESFLAPNLGVLNNIEKTRENRNFEPEPEIEKKKLIAMQNL